MNVFASGKSENKVHLNINVFTVVMIA